MLVTVLFSFAVDTVTYVLSLLPSLPEVSTDISSVADQIIPLVALPISWLMHIYGQSLFLSLITAGMGLIFFENAYHTVMWVVRKLPIASH